MANINDADTYRIALSDFLLTGGEKGLAFLTKDNPEISKIYAPDPKDKNDIKNDIRLIVNEYMRKMGK